MALIYFNKELCWKAMKIINAKGSAEKIKASNDIRQIDNIIAEYIEKGKYNQINAASIDIRIRQEHKITINNIDAISVPNTFMPNKRILTTNDPLINRLFIDKYGILYDVIKKEGVVHKLEEFIEHVE